MRASATPGRDPAWPRVVAGVRGGAPSPAFPGSSSASYTCARIRRVGSALTPGTRLGTYDILATLGEGGMGAVYRARDTKLQRDVATKVLLPDVASSPERLARFQREAQVLAALNHPHIAHIHGLEEGQATGGQAGLAGQVGQAGTIALVMELVEGLTLQELIERAPGSGLQASGFRIAA